MSAPSFLLAIAEAQNAHRRLRSLGRFNPRRKDAAQLTQPAIPYAFALSYMLNYSAPMGVSGVFARNVFGKNFPAVRAYQFET